MRIIKSIDKMREYSYQLKQIGKTIGSVGTEEGNLHDGHMSLVKIAKENTDVVVLDLLHTVNHFECSPEEYEEQLKVYEQDFLEKDIELCKLNNVDVLFLPSMHDIYLNILPLNISIPVIERWLMIWKPHAKFIIANREMYTIILPDVTVLGQKDVYQNFATKYLIKQLGLPIKVIIAPTIRDSNGVALGSRNISLNKDELINVSSIYQTLHEISKWSTYPSIDKIKEHITNRINQANGSIYYIDICCPETLEELNSIDKKFIIIITAKFGKIDVGDNIIIEPK